MNHCILVAHLVILEVNAHLLIFIAFGDGTSFYRFFVFFLVAIILDVLDHEGNGWNFVRAIFVLIGIFAKFPFRFWDFLLFVCFFKVIVILFRFIV